jgi:hypothetical protein
MASSCDRRNPLTRNGANQRERALPALDPDYFRVDERTTADLIRFAERFSRHVKYYPEASDDAKVKAPDWQPFFTRDVAAILAGLATLPVAAFQAFSRALQEYLADDPGRSEADLQAHFKLALHLPVLLLRSAGAHFDRLPPDHPLRAFMRTVMIRDAAVPLEDLVEFYKGALALADPPINGASLFPDTALDPEDYNTDLHDADPRIQLPTAVTERIAGAPALPALDLSADLVQGFAPAGWGPFYDGIAPDTLPYEASLAAPADRVYHQIYDALNYNLLATALQRLFQALACVAREADRLLQESLTGFDGHTPHYGLWLAFLRLLEVNRRHLNTLTGRHLDHYYRDVLRLCPRGPEPDRVHLVLEPGRSVEEHLLPAATTLFRAGKDATGQEILYRLDGDLVVNRGTVESLKAVQGRARPVASPVADSRDGQGAPLPKDDPQWPPFGPASGAPAARIGFAVADRQLFLREGARDIALVVRPDRPLASKFPGLKVSLTGEKGWIDVVDPSKVLTAVLDGLLYVLIRLQADDPPVVAHDPAVHGEGYPGSEPVVRVELAFAERPAESAALFSLLRDVEFRELLLYVHVEDVHDVTLQNEAGTIDPAKPFLPFGATPGANSPLILGSSELFSKKLAKITMHVVWERPLTAEGYFLRGGPDRHKARLRGLRGGKWEGADSPYDVTLFPDNGVAIPIELPNLSSLSDAAKPTRKNVPYAADATAGFIKLELQRGFGHRDHLDAKTLATIDLAKSPNVSVMSMTTSTATPGIDAITSPLVAIGLPSEPYTPKVMEFSLSYTTVPQAPARFFHLHPFGFTSRSAAGGRLLPELAHAGALHIGIRGLKPPQRLTLLAQVADGTANPLKGETSLEWHYLRGNEWVPLPDQAVDDKTRNLTGSGIVGLAVPEDADTEHTILPAGLHWFRMAAASDTDALNNLRGIFAQAGAATLSDAVRDPSLLARPRPPGTVAKLKTPDAAIKKVSQPFPSFGGRAAESPRAFAIRASERLRHKDRAATMWDYEHLVLEHFPGVYRVRCINHTELVRDAANNVLADNEVKPGHVLVVAVPYMRGGGAGDPLRPYADTRTLRAIDAFLRARLSPFVQLEVQNPKFEEVQVEFTVIFTPDIADLAFYKDELNRAIVRYLSPWAYAAGVEISFGGRWHKSAIIDFVEEQPYVDHVTDFKMYHRSDPTAREWVRTDEEVVQATTARSILVSHPAHVIHG